MESTYTKPEPASDVTPAATPSRLLQHPVSNGNGPLEREADRIADQIASPPTHSATVQPAAHVVRSGSAVSSNTASLPASVDQTISQAGEPLEPAVKHEMEQRFGHDFSHVRVHSNNAAERSTSDVDANAYAVGNHIAFAPGRYTPSTRDGRHLIAHELTHVVQQSGVPAGIQRDAKKDADTPPKIVAPRAPTPAQQKVIDTARRAAAVRTQVAMFRARGHEGSSRFADARRFAQLKFNWPDPNMDQIGDILSNMGGGLINVEVKVAAPGDTECGARSGYVRGHRPPIVLCPAFFSSSAESQIRTMIHEMAHVVGIGNADAAEQYYVIFDCDSPGEFGSADAWANYVNCLSDQTPDKPPQITAPRAGKGGKPPANKPDTTK
jgi:hypothetical protein